MVGNPEDALDATQEAMIAIARGIGRFDGRAAFTTWLYRVATNAALDELRRRGRRPRPVSRTCPSPWRRAGRRSGSARASTSTPRSATLPEEFRVAVVLRDLCDLDYAEIAAVLDVPPGTVRSRIARGRGRRSPSASSGTPRPPARPSEGP